MNHSFRALFNSINQKDKGISGNCSGFYVSERVIAIFSDGSCGQLTIYKFFCNKNIIIGFTHEKVRENVYL